MSFKDTSYAESSTSRRKGKRPRKESSTDISIEELLPEDIGYDADIEVLLPNQYEDVESEPEDDRTMHRRPRSVDEDLAARMKKLGKDKLATERPGTPDSMRGRKRRSLHGEDRNETSHDRDTDFEIIDLAECYRGSPPTKKRRKRGRPDEIKAQETTTNDDETVDMSSSHRQHDINRHIPEIDDVMDVS